MRCKKHYLYDTTSAIGVCASCLRERLVAVIAAQAQAEAVKAASDPPPPLASNGASLLPPAPSSALDCRKLDNRRTPEHHHHEPPPAPLIFPSSVSSYISRRKSTAAEDHSWPTPDHRHDRATFYHHRFFSTPQVGPGESKNDNKKAATNKHGSRFGLIANLFRSRSRNFGHLDPDSDPRFPAPPSSSCKASSSSPASNSSFSWIPGLARRRIRNRSEKISNGKNTGTTMMSLFALETTEAPAAEDADGGRRTGRRYCRRDRGMSPNCEEDGWDDGSPFPGDDCSPEHYSQEVKMTPTWKKTPSAARPGQRRVRPSPASSSVAAGFGFCLSPLIRGVGGGGPNRQWNTPEISYSGEIRDPAKPHLSSAASFCANRSRKLADFGRFSHNC